MVNIHAGAAGMSVRKAAALLLTLAMGVCPAIYADTPISSGDDAITIFPNKEAQYRIPAIVECKSGKLIAFTDHRYQFDDIGGGRRSTL